MSASIFYFNPSPIWLRIIEVSGYLLPFIGYFLFFYDIPAFANWSRIARPAVLTLLFAAATAVGFHSMLFLTFLLFMAFGGHHW